MNNNRLTAETEIKAKAQRIEELVFLYESRASEVASLKEAATLLARAASLANTRLNKPFLAEELLQRALAYDPCSLEALREFQFLCEQRKDLLSLAETLERLAELYKPEESADCLLRAARLFEQLQFFDRAERCCKLAVKAVPSHQETFRQARQILIATGNFFAAYELLQQEAAQVPADTLVDEHLLLAEAVIEDPQSWELSKQIFTFLAEIDSSNERLCELQQKFSQFSTNWKAHIQTFREAAQKETNRQQAAKHFLKIAKIYAFFESDIAERKKGMKEALDQCFLLWPAMPGALGLLEHGAKSSGRYDIVVSAFEKLAHETKDRNAKIALYLRLGQLALEKLGNQVVAAAAFENASLNDPARSDLVGVAVELALARGDISKALQLLEKNFEAQTGNVEKAKILVKVADIALAYSKDDAKARLAFEKALGLTPKDGMLVFRLAQLLLKAEDVSELAALLPRAMKAPKPLQERITLCEEAASLFSQKEEPAKAFLAWGLVIQLFPSKTEHLQKLAQVAAQANAQETCIQLLRKVAQKADKKTAVVFWKAIAQQLSALDKASESKEAWLEVQKIDPDDAELLSALESLKSLPSSEAEAEDERLLLLQQARDLEANNASPQALLDIYRKHLHLEPEDTEVLRKMVDVNGKLERWDEAALYLEKLVALLPESKERNVWRIFFAQIQNEKLGRKDEAAQLYLSLLAEGDANAEVISSLEQLASEGIEQLRISQALAPHGVKVGEQVASTGETSETQLMPTDSTAAETVLPKEHKVAEHGIGKQHEAVLRCQEILAKKPNDEKAIETLNELLSAPETQADAARALLPVYERTRDYRKWVVALEVVSRTTADLLEKINAFRQIAAIQAKFLKQPEQSFVAFTHAMRLAPDDKQLRLAARLSAEQADVLDMYAEVLEEMLEAPQCPGQLGLRRELADAFEKLGKPQKATGQLEAILSLEPNNIEVLESLLKFYRVQQNWNGLVQILERLADVSAELPNKLKFGREAALISEENLEDKARAAQNWRLISERDISAKDAAIALERLYAALDWPQELVFALELRRSQEGETPLGLELTFRLAELRRERLQDEFGALQLYRHILLQSPSNLPTQTVLEQWAQKNDPLGTQALEILDPIWAKQNEHNKRVLVREALLKQTSPALGAQLVSQICEIQEKELGQPSAAFMSALKAFSEGLERETIQPHLERLAKATASELELAEIYENVAGQLSDIDESKQKWIRCSAQLWEQQGQIEDALRLWQLLLGISPEDSQALDRLEKLYSQNKDAAELAQIYLRKAELSTEVDEKISLLNQAGLAFEATGKEQTAHDVFKLSVSLQPTKEALEALERFYARNKQFGAQADVLNKLVEFSSTDLEKLRLLTKRAQLLERESRLEDVIQTWSAALSIQPSYPEAIAGMEGLLANASVRIEALQSLEPHYRQTQDYKKLADLLEQKLEFVERGFRVELLCEVARLRELLGEKMHALNAWVRAYQENIESEAVQKELERLSAELGAFEVLVGCYEDLREGMLPAAVALVLARKVAILYQEKLSRPEAAIRVWMQILEQQPQDKEALEALSKIYRELQRPKELAWVMQQQVTIEENPQRKVKLLEHLAELAQAILLDNSLAISCFQSILQCDPQNAQATQNLLKLLPESERYLEFAEFLAGQIQQAKAKGEEDKELELKVRLGRLMVFRLENPRAALDLFADALAQRANYPQAIGALEEMVKSNSSLKGEAAKLLDPIFSGGGDHLKLVQTLESRLESETEEQERLGLFLRIIHVYKQELANAEMAFLTAARSLREFSGSAELLKECSELAEVTEGGDEFVGLLEEIVEKTTNAAALANLYRMRALWQMKLKDSKGSIQSWLQVLEHAPADFQALQEITNHWEANNELENLLGLIKRQLFLEEDTEKRCELMLRLGSIQERLRDFSSATATFRRLLEISPDHPQALEFIERIYEQQQHWPELSEILTRRLEVVKGDERYPLMLRLATIREGRLADLQGALELYAQLLRHDPRFPGALERVNAIVRKSPQEIMAVHLLLESHRATHNRNELIQVIENRVAVSMDSAERHALLSELAKAREAQGEPELAFLAALRAFNEIPQDDHARSELVRLAETLGSFEELAGALEEALPQLFEPTAESRVCLELASVYEKHLNDLQTAAGYYERALRAGVASPIEAWKALEHIYGKLNQHQSQVDILEQLLAWTKDNAEKIPLLYRVGELHEHKLKDVAAASYAYERILEIDSNNLPSARALEFLYESLNEHGKLRAILQTQRELVAGSEKDRVTAKLASLTADVSEDFSEAIALYEELVSKNPRNDQAALALENLLEKAGQHQQLLHLLKRRLTVMLEPRELVRLNQAAGRVLWKQLNKPQEAIAYFKAALERDVRAKEALEALREIFDLQGQKEDLIVVLRRLLPLQTEPLAIKEIRLKLADVLASLGRREEALESAKRGLEIEPHHIPMLDQALSVFYKLQAWNDLIHTLELQTQLFLEEQQEEEAVRVLFQVADIWKTKIGKPENGGAALEKIFLIDMSNRSAYEQALNLYASVNDWRSYVQTINRFLPNFVTDDERVAALCSLARVQEQKLGQKDVAFLQLCRALQIQPENGSLRDAAVRLANETQSYEELAAVFEEIAETLPSGPLASQMYRLLANIQDLHIGDVDAAEASFQKILEFDPTSRDALEGLESLLERYGRHQSLAAVLDRKIELSETSEDKKSVLLKLATLQEKHLNNSVAAVRALERAFELIPDHASLDVLCRLRREQGDFELMVANILRLRELVSHQEASKLQLQIAQIYEDDLHDKEAAIEAYQGVLAFEKHHLLALKSIERLLTEADRPIELLELLEKRIAASENLSERIALYFQQADIWESRLQNLEQADACIQAALGIDPSNTEALRVLERLRYSRGDWQGLIDVFEKQSSLQSKPADKAKLLVVMGQVFQQRLAHVEKATLAYQQALHFNPQNCDAVHALASVFEAQKNWPSALEMLRKEAKLVGENKSTASLHHRIGQIHEEEMKDMVSAKKAYLEALKFDELHLPSLVALKSIYYQEKTWTTYESTLNKIIQLVSEPESKSQYLLEFGDYLREVKEDFELAENIYVKALKEKPNLLAAARPLVDLCVASERWPDAARALEVVVQHLENELPQDSDGSKARELCRFVYRLAYVCEKLGEDTRALECFQRAHELDPSYLSALEGLGNRLMKSGRHEEALHVYQNILIYHRDVLADFEVVEIYWMLGDLYVTLKQLDKAANQFERALALDAQHEPSLVSLSNLAQAAKNWEQVADCYRRLLQLVEGDKQYQLAMSLGDVSKNHLHDTWQAIDAYSIALRSQPQSLQAMECLCVLSEETGQFAKAGDLLRRMLEIEEVKSSPERSKQAYKRLGILLRDKLSDIDGAAKALNAALDLDFRFIEAFQALESMLGKQRRWGELESNYHRMIQRLPKTDDMFSARMALFRTLGDLYLNVLKRVPEATQVYAVLAKGLPRDAHVQETYATLARQTGKLDEALAAYRRASLTTQNLTKVAVELATLSVEKKHLDSAWLAAQAATVFLDSKGEDEKAIVQKLARWARKKGLPQKPLTAQHWNALYHPSVRGQQREFLGLLYLHAGALFKEEHASYQMNPRKHQLDLSKSLEYQLGQLKEVSRLLGADAIPVFSPFLVFSRAKRGSETPPEASIGVEICNTSPISIKLGGRFFSETGQNEVCFWLAKTLTLMRPEFVWTRIMPLERLEILFQAAVSLTQEPFPYTVNVQQMEPDRQALNRVLPLMVRNRLKQLAKEMVASHAHGGLTGYFEGAEMTALRVGALLTTEAAPIKKILNAEQGVMAPALLQRRIRDLVEFMLSEEFIFLRGDLGIQVDVA